MTLCRLKKKKCQLSIIVVDYCDFILLSTTSSTIQCFSMDGKTFILFSGDLVCIYIICR